MEHYRMIDGNLVLSQGHFCTNCGEPCGVMGHYSGKYNKPFTCKENTSLVNEIFKLNEKG